ncbi:MAG TPA: radical SAM protein [Methanotrichaceae archaeon]|nr:MAG: pyrroloquinoline quinone biosynthesis protein PqqE [Methanosaeta sp. PtaU1.Bin028]HQF16915.1 radical SAM protein [Methanotrichaceae archaeon]HQI91482.1 radical SAM protein [Methanotrichaceae archaeon]HQJ28820.1 radical SAM protein [Methanotrichaceae archaeon]
MPIAETSVLSVDLRSDGGRIRLVPSGPLAVLASPVIDLINRVFADEKPISSGQQTIFSTWIPPAPSPAFDRMISSQIGAILRRRVPDQFSIAVVRACPNRCLHCAAPSRGGEVLPSETVRRVVNEALQLGSYLITFDGGEPMLRHDLPDLVASVDSRAVATSFSSGYGLTPDRARCLKAAGIYAVRISIDSPLAQQHDKFRGREGAFADALAGAESALKAGILTDLFMVVSPHNIDQLEEAYSLACRMGVHELSFYEIVAVGRWCDHLDETLSKGDISRLKAFHRSKNANVEGPRVTALPYLLSPEMFGCFAGRRWIHVDASGEALPCAYLPLSFGNVRKQSLADIWRKMSRYRCFSAKCACLMKDQAFRQDHSSILAGMHDERE